jgi:riboflavin synthase
MFTGIIETVGKVTEIISKGSNKSFWIESPLSSSFAIDQSVSHDGICLTVEEIKVGQHKVTAIDETLKKTCLESWRRGSLVNIERSLLINGRLDGHIVQGHVDTTAVCREIKEKKGSWEYEFEFSKKFAPLIIEKGSICINGISLTAFDVKKKSFKVAIIPYTFEHTNIKQNKKGDAINIEFDMIGKYLLRRLSLKRK